MKKFKKIVPIVIISIYALGFTFDLSRYLTECKMQKQMEQNITKMQIQTELLLNENGYKWDGIQIVEMEKEKEKNEQ